MPPLFASEDLWLPFVSSTEKPEATFLWPKHAVHILHRPCPSLDDDLKNTLEECGILNKEAVEDNKDKMMMREGLEMAAMMCGKGVGKRDIFITFDTFLARSRPGLGEKEGADSTNKKKNNKKKKKNKKNKKAAAAEGNEPSNWNEEAACKENSKPKTLGWSNPAWGPRVPESNPAWGPKPMMGMTRTQSPGLVSTKPTEGPKKPGWKNKALAPTFSRFEKSLYLSLHYHTIRFRVSLFLRNLFSLLFRFLPPRTAYSPWLLFVHIPTVSSHFSQISTSSLGFHHYLMKKIASNLLYRALIKVFAGC